jgi:type II secretory pathway component PulK
VLAAVIENLSVADAQNVLKKRASTPFKDLSALSEALPPTAKCPDNGCDVKSNYFMAIVRVKSGRIEAGYAALLARTTTGAPSAWPGIIWRKEAAD